MNERIYSAYKDRYRNLPPHEIEEMAEADDDGIEEDGSGVV